jgi:peptidyl-prolyl cis-trans isomerase SurA
MKRQFVAGLIGLTLAGCAQSRSTLTQKKGKADDPVAIQPVPSIYETINRGTGNPAVASSTLPNPSASHWSATAVPSTAGQPAAGGSAPGTGLNPAAGYPLASGPQGESVQNQLMPGAVPPSAGAALLPLSAGSADGQTSPAGFGPVGATAPVAGAATGMPTAVDARTALAPTPSLVEAGAAQPQGSALPELPPLDPSSKPADAQGAFSPGAMTTSSATADLAVSPSGSVTATTPSSPAVAAPAARGGDPLLGPNPDLMPPLDISSIPARVSSNSGGRGVGARAKPAPPAGLPESGPTPSTATGLSAPAAIAPIAASPAAGPTVPNTSSTAPISSSPASQPAAPATELMPPADLAPPGDLAPPADLAPAPVGSDKPAGTASSGPGHGPGFDPNIALVSADSLESAPSASSSQPATGALQNPSGVSGAKASDRKIIRASFQKTPAVDRVEELKTDPNHSWKEAGRPAARVGDDIITVEDLISAIGEYYRTQLPRGTHLTKPEKQMLGENILRQLIDRTLVVQEVKRQVKNPKDLDRLMSIADKYWLSEKVPPLLSRYTANNERELSEKMREQNQSLAALKEDFKQQFLSESYLHEKLKDQVKVSLPDLLKYYNEHITKHTFDRAAQITWREIVIDTSKNTSRELARKKADELLARIRKGEDFARLAKTESNGPSHSRDQGGLMQTSPGGYAISEVNQALETLPVGQVGDVIEGPDGFHIVRVEQRRPAGPATFAEVNEKIRIILDQQRRAEAHAAMLDKIRRKTLITTIFDGTNNDGRAAGNSLSAR